MMDLAARLPATAYAHPVQLPVRKKHVVEMNDASHKIGSISSSSKASAVTTPSTLPEPERAQDTTCVAKDAAKHGGTPSAMFALSAVGLLVGAFAVIGPDHVSVAVAKTLLTVGCLLVAALAGVVAADLSRDRR
jgi:hypothetical protein